MLWALPPLLFGGLRPLGACSETCRAYLRSPATSRGPTRRLGLAVKLASEFRHLWPTCVPGFLKNRRDLGVGEEVLPALRIPVEEHPDPALLIGVAKGVRTLGPVLLSLLKACDTACPLRRSSRGDWIGVAMHDLPAGDPASSGRPLSIYPLGGCQVLRVGPTGSVHGRFVSVAVGRSRRHENPA
jgi:hypothetical protein